jgi:hypothetical protein
VLLLFGGFLALIGWLVGLVLLWSSPRWTVVDKLVGTLVLPGGLASALLLGSATWGEGCSPTCNGHGWGPSTIHSILGLAVAVSPLLITRYLSLRLRRVR